MSSETIQNLNGINIDKLRALHMAYLSPENASDTNYRYENAIQKILSFLFIVPNVVFRSEEQIKNEGLVTGVQAAFRGQQARKEFKQTKEATEKFRQHSWTTSTKRFSREKKINNKCPGKSTGRCSKKRTKTSDGYLARGRNT